MTALESHDVTPDLAAENRRLRTLLAELSADLGLRQFTASPPWGLTRQEFALLACLAKNSPAPNWQLLRAIKAHSNRPFFEEKILDVLLCRVRQKIAPEGFTIKTTRGEGRTLCAAGCVAVSQWLEQASA